MNVIGRLNLRDKFCETLTAIVPITAGISTPNLSCMIRAPMGCPPKDFTICSLSIFSREREWRRNQEGHPGCRQSTACMNRKASLDCRTEGNVVRLQGQGPLIVLARSLSEARLI